MIVIRTGEVSGGGMSLITDNEWGRGFGTGKPMNMI
jgi:hypothetical protein